MRGERDGRLIPVKRKKVIVDNNTTTKMIEIGVNEFHFHFLKGVLPRYCFYFTLLDEVDIIERMFLDSS